MILIKYTELPVVLNSLLGRGILKESSLKEVLGCILLQEYVGMILLKNTVQILFLHIKLSQNWNQANCFQIIYHYVHGRLIYWVLNLFRIICHLRKTYLVPCSVMVWNALSILCSLIFFCVLVYAWLRTKYVSMSYGKPVSDLSLEAVRCLKQHLFPLHMLEKTYGKVIRTRKKISAFWNSNKWWWRQGLHSLVLTIFPVQFGIWREWPLFMATRTNQTLLA